MTTPSPDFLPAEALGLTDEQHDALVRTLDALEQGHPFDMKRWPEDVSERGAAMDLAGIAEALVQKPIFDSAWSDVHTPLESLFFPGDAALHCTDPALGARALRNFLTTGEARWDEVLADGT